jgi:hypothetical protein
MATATAARQGSKCLRSIRLRTLLVLLSVVCLACGWEANRLRRRTQAVALLHEWGIHVTEEDRGADDMPWRVLPTWASDWLSPWRRAYADLDSEITLRATSSPSSTNCMVEGWREPSHRGARDVTPAERKALVAAIATLTELQSVQVSLELDDDDLGTLSPLKDLGILGFRSCQLTEAGVAQLRMHHKVHGLVVCFDRPDCVSVSAIAALRELTSLELLVLSGPIPRADVARLTAALPRVDVKVHAPSN